MFPEYVMNGDVVPVFHLIPRCVVGKRGGYPRWAHAEDSPVMLQASISDGFGEERPVVLSESFVFNFNIQ